MGVEIQLATLQGGGRMRILLLFLVIVSAAPPSDRCCSEKKVGDIHYTLAGSDMNETAKYGCTDGCIYKASDDRNFCFTTGDLPVACLDGDCDFHWCYVGDCGPAYWGDYCQACNGMKQSPIDIVTTDYEYYYYGPEYASSSLTFGNYDKLRANHLVMSNSEEHYGPKNGRGTRLESGTFKNNGHTARLDVTANLTEDIGILSGGPLNGSYQILQLHFHWGANDSYGSEHTVDGKMYPLEMHIVHTKVGETNPLSVAGGLAVAGFFFEIESEDNPAVEPLVSVLKNVQNPDEKFDMAGSEFQISALIDPVVNSFRFDPVVNSVYSSYSGSLTTPGCNEVVNWINFFYDTIPISSAQLQKFRMLKDNSDEDIVDNFRPVQPLNGRKVAFYLNLLSA